jgi:hemolysin activation/secretion protein
MTINDPLVEQQVNYALASVGAGTRIKIMDHLNGSLDLGVPLNDGTTTKAYSEVLTFRVWADF